ncbi:hypothetical protein PSN45_001958 [Yamadazyma tenuis]|uniref:Zn(2)-C6 fungal-type domain-containing protein n=1 Tax=Candida tenuis (strain ATCC 10573 / BCRC 21748 / CBS 615 / JCM 9827 / NBRC 10315 / NRRL Y-1498 / VKM Y-70) TaxID=590646 RepID=G3BDA7_CANTC|nr:uncharacterized protein CANTEDRAFT_95736 [Yamadazyma tenuis ATCC 10573]EGV60283.1 hypothetical protein CANTEDRAFT_95736 [Yamadazyma tenuis ATCC 10573]WEJ94474.1 hypothetical protein PSN45_001958 [Yamadazyma tenuis]
MSTVSKPRPLKVYGRAHYACTHCKSSKTKCSGGHPCSNCKNLNRAESCIYPTRDRKIVIMESDLNKLHDQVKYWETVFSGGTTGGQRPDSFADIEPSRANNIIQERLNEETKEFLFNSQGLEDYLVSDDANETIKWKLLTFISERIPSRDVTQRLIHTVVDNYANEFYLVDQTAYPEIVDNVYMLLDAINNKQETIARRLNSKVKRYHLCYFFSLIAYGEQISNSITSHDAIPGMQFYMLGSELLNLTHEVVGFEFIQASILLALYSANLNRYNTVYNYFGVAIRSAISQGFHRQPTHSLSTDPDLLVRNEKSKRLWWTVYVTDATWTAKLNLPSQIDYSETDVDLPGENSIDLADGFELNLLDVNVQLAKHISKSVEKIYGANMRTFSVNYINTDQFTRKTQIQSVMTCFKEVVKDFEVPYLFQYKNCNVIEQLGRKLVNLFLRFNLLIAMISKPLISLIFNTSHTSIFDEPAEVEIIVNRAIASSIANINLLIKLYEVDRLFTIGFFDSQYLFTGLLIIIMSSITDRHCLEIVNKAIALLRHMANSGNINAKNAMKKLAQVNDFLSKTPEIDFSLNLDLDIRDMVPVSKSFDIQSHYYNPYEDFSCSSLANFKIYKPTPPIIERPASLRVQMLNPNTELKNHQIQSRIEESAASAGDEEANPPAFFASSVPVNESVAPPNIRENDYGQSNSFYNYNYDELSPDVFTNNRVSNLSGASQNTLLTMMNNLQSQDYINF